MAPDVTRTASPSIAPALTSLAVGGFAIGTTEFVTMGLLPDIARGLDVSIPAAGRVISAYALGVVVGAPLLAVLTARIPRTRLLMALMVAFALGNVASALAPSYTGLVLARFLSGVPHGAYFGIASLVAASLMGPGKRGQGVAFVLSGLTIANVIGVPFITWIGQEHGWRIAYLVVAAIFALTFAAVALLVPWQAGDPKATLRNELKAFTRLQVWLALLIGAIGFGGFFAVYTYVAPMVTTVTGLPASAVPLVLILIGVGMTVGNLLGGRMADRSVERGMLAFFGVMLAGLATLFLTAWSLTGLLVSVFVIAAAASALSPMIQTRLMDVAHDSQSIAAALNHSALNIANAAGAFLGGLTIAAGFGYLSPVVVGAVLAVAGIVLALVSFGIDHARVRRGVDTGVVHAQRPDPVPID